MMKHLFRKIKYLFSLYIKKSLFWSRYSDAFYSFQQDKLRGSITEIKQRQSIYLPYIKKIGKEHFISAPFLDCGFGRGEFLELLRENEIPHIIGVDTNKQFIDAVYKKKFRVIQSDILQFLYLSSHSFSGISAFHLIEHFTFPQLFDFLLLCNKKLMKKGILILETPNIENIKVSATTFYYDHTHIQKIPRIFLEFILKFVGFSRIESIYLHPAKEVLSTEVDGLLFGAQDLGIIAYK